LGIGRRIITLTRNVVIHTAYLLYGSQTMEIKM